jgi:hypothetical protein
VVAFFKDRRRLQAGRERLAQLSSPSGGLCVRH